mmetsp:Transcript_72184/g.233535  ORF Transcript_72184/g.233535 Transcript_72184/m.233535 type:complete len:129 (+) Transcript_72184:284-670(+)
MGTCVDISTEDSHLEGSLLPGVPPGASSGAACLATASPERGASTGLLAQGPNDGLALGPSTGLACGPSCGLAHAASGGHRLLPAASAAPAGPGDEARASGEPVNGAEAVWPRAKAMPKSRGLSRRSVK